MQSQIKVRETDMQWRESWAIILVSPAERMGFCKDLKAGESCVLLWGKEF